MRTVYPGSASEGNVACEVRGPQAGIAIGRLVGAWGGFLLPIGAAQEAMSWLGLAIGALGSRIMREESWERSC
jgi:hypothetical protein